MPRRIQPGPSGVDRLAGQRSELQRKSNGTRWTNEELLFHMVFGYMIFRSLLPLVRIMSRLPRSWGRRFAAGLNAAAGPFDVVNYWGSRVAAAVSNRRRIPHTARPDAWDA
ncbi:hypothetical protein ACSVHC_15310 [Arthrobacter sp. KNU-44]|uniref:hypothetical protein n=1 Tax=unclassified Arthrobacter TaxID=235627 RepID=UPI003F43C58E